jgi:hypothetical protein
VTVSKLFYYLFLTTIGLTPGGSSTAHIYTNSTQNTENGTYITIKKSEVRAVLRRCELYPGIYLTTEEKARKNFS